jgi:hypothetical protein
MYALSHPSYVQTNGLSFACDRKCAANLAGRLNDLVHPSCVHLIVLYSDGNLARGAGENGVRGVSATSDIPASEEAS